jgi:hypothetical protein
MVVMLPEQQEETLIYRINRFFVNLQGYEEERKAG